MENQKKEFDSTVSFMFFADWFEAIEDAETDADRESEAYMLFKAIANYSLFDKEPDFEKYPANRSFKRFWSMLSGQIDASIKNRKRGFRDTDGKTENAKKVIAAYRENPHASVREISDKTGVSKSEVQRVKRKYLSDIDIPDIVPNSVPGAGVGAIPDTGVDADAYVIPDTGANSIPNANAYTYTNTGRDTGQDGTRDRTGHGTRRDGTRDSLIFPLFLVSW